LPYIDSSVSKVINVFIQRIYHRGKVLYINIDMLLFSCQIKYVGIKAERITKQNWTLLSAWWLTRWCFWYEKRYRTSFNILYIIRVFL